MGLIHYIYERETFWDEVMTYARQFCPPNKASRAVGTHQAGGGHRIGVRFGGSVGNRAGTAAAFIHERRRQGRIEGIRRKAAAEFQREVNCKGSNRAGNAMASRVHKGRMRTLPDYLRKGMKLMIVGRNPADRRCARDITTPAGTINSGRHCTKPAWCRSRLDIRMTGESSNSGLA